ncbi:MAG: hypothetical protein LBF77_00080 [Spirochaetaceae bacterium]|nr:hypothetical protein [Spirochaetaceae bacterium]
MGIMLGNLTIKEFSERSKVVFNDDDIKYLEEHREEHATIIPKNRFHIFDMPFSVVCGSREFAHELYDVIKKYDFSMSPLLRIDALEE